MYRRVDVYLRIKKNTILPDLILSTAPAAPVWTDSSPCAAAACALSCSSSSSSSNSVCAEGSSAFTVVTSADAAPLLALTVAPAPALVLSKPGGSSGSVRFARSTRSGSSSRTADCAVHSLSGRISTATVSSWIARFWFSSPFMKICCG